MTTAQGRPPLILLTLLTEAALLLAALQPTFTQPTFQRFTLLMAVALLTSGRRTIANLLRSRQVAQANGVGRWYKAGSGLVPIRWVFVRDQSGTHREEYFFTTDVTLTIAAIIGCYTSRWNIETTFQELRDYLGLETTRGWCRGTVLRLAPCLFGLDTVVAVRYAALPESKRCGSIVWPGKQAVTFSDALTGVRRWLWAEGVFSQASGGMARENSLRRYVKSSLQPSHPPRKLHQPPPWSRPNGAIAVGPLQPRSLARMVKQSMANRGWRRRCRLRGSGTSARA